ncbi:chemotaxis protein CheC [Sulfurospirillum diekertiae]|jgi:chemotaxis protein CheC|uniref:Chemotaxis protein CheC n=1 Tax=Sulfurospirillum diekertiae TaxID=1854492 RepID=A0A6G9VRN4_9BACT|nr:chemotaxis protein CheC [Sulfurospirillum diekertiae]QIR75615.1 chemotaxis protein CheC [Sulfurospirillum diekertiae]QIR78263.1 chemotaxis protein CheC [Sulfurospirillum diekertiae]
MTKSSFNPQQEDILKELINVSFGLSASLIGDMLDNRAKLHIPEISSIDIQYLDDKIIEVLDNDSEFYLTKQRFLGSFNGEVLFVFNNYSAKVFCSLLLKQEISDESDIKSSIMELTNIITSACIGKFCEIIHGETIFKVPSIEKRDISEMDKYDKIEGYDNVIVIKTALDIEKENILGHMFILLNNEMLEQLKCTIDKLEQ